VSAISGLTFEKQNNIVRVSHGKSGKQSEIQFTRRWEALFLELLMHRGKSLKNPSLSYEDFMDEAAKAGQSTNLNRAQMARILDSLYGGFDSINAGYWFRGQFQFPPRKRTVGPWTWKEAAAFERRKSDHRSVSIAPNVKFNTRHVPRLTTKNDSAAIRALLEDFLVVDTCAFDGDFLEAASHIEHLKWKHASLTAQALVHVRRVRMLTLAGALDDATLAIKSLSNNYSKLPPVQSKWLIEHIQTLTLRIEYARNPVSSSPHIINALLQMQFDQNQVADPLLAGARANLLSLTYRREMERHGQARHPAIAKKFFARSLNALSTAITCYLSAMAYEDVQRCCVNSAYLYQKAFNLKLTSSVDETLGWYQAAFAWNNKFNLSENSAWEYIMLGELYLDETKVRERLGTGKVRLLWHGKSPQSAEFYSDAVNVAKRLGDPLQYLHTVLNALRFNTAFGSKDIAAKNLRQFRLLAKQHPEQVETLKTEGYTLP
jgi:tetratricopeptide (TPR) repeat protein